MGEVSQPQNNFRCSDGASGLASDTGVNGAAWAALLETAWAALERAHAPYSGFRVGAAALMSDGTISAGCNVENASYPLGICAERVALGAAVANFRLRPGQLTAMAVVSEAEGLTPPCGACRQTMAEFARDIPILLANRHRKKLHRLKDIFPEAFTRGNLAVEA